MTGDCPISVVVPCYNSAEYLAGAVASVVAQEMSGVEIIIVDDASTDSTVAVARTIAARTPNVTILEQGVNAGQAAARNRGARRASGRYLCFLDADDTYAPDFFHSVRPILESELRLAAVVTGIELLNCSQVFDPVQLKAVVMSSPSNLLIRRSVFEILGGLPEGEVFRGPSGGEDATFRMALTKFFHVGHCDEKFLRYWVKSDSHFLYFLKRSSVVDGRIVMSSLTTEEQSGEVQTARQAYFQRVREQLEASSYLKMSRGA